MANLKIKHLQIYAIILSDITTSNDKKKFAICKLFYCTQYI